MSNNQLNKIDIEEVNNLEDGIIKDEILNEFDPKNYGYEEEEEVKVIYLEFDGYKVHENSVSINKIRRNFFVDKHRAEFQSEIVDWEKSMRENKCEICNNHFLKDNCDVVPNNNYGQNIPFLKLPSVCSVPQCKGLSYWGLVASESRVIPVEPFLYIGDSFWGSTKDCLKTDSFHNYKLGGVNYNGFKILDKFIEELNEARVKKELTGYRCVYCKSGYSVRYPAYLKFEDTYFDMPWRDFFSQRRQIYFKF